MSDSVSGMARTFDEWWQREGYHQMPRGDQPPEHAAIAKLAWDAALLGVVISEPQTELARRLCSLSRVVPADHHKGEECPRCDAIEIALRGVEMYTNFKEIDFELERKSKLILELKAKLLNATAHWEKYRDKMLVGFQSLVSDESRDMCRLQIDMADRFIDSLNMPEITFTVIATPNGPTSVQLGTTTGVAKSTPLKDLIAAGQKMRRNYDLQENWREGGAVSDWDDALGKIDQP